MQDVHQIEAFRIPLHVELTELLGFYFDLVQNCARGFCRHFMRNTTLKRTLAKTDAAQERNQSTQKILPIV